MKKIVLLSIVTFVLLFHVDAAAQKDNDKRKSPRTTTKQTLASTVDIAISYGQVQVKGRTIGKDLEPKEGKIWRTGADEATVFEVSKAVKINGQDLPAGKYSFFTLVQNGEWTLIFNKTSDQWGAYDYKEKEDALRIKVKPQTGTFTEKLSFLITENGDIVLNWGDSKISFKVQ